MAGKTYRFNGKAAVPTRRAGLKGQVSVPISIREIPTLMRNISVQCRCTFDFYQWSHFLVVLYKVLKLHVRDTTAWFQARLPSTPLKAHNKRFNYI